jgi:hypothetical protein
MRIRKVKGDGPGLKPLLLLRFFAGLPFDFAPFLRQGKQDKKAHASTVTR